jgi:F-type H+-transporting ATPase subunit a
MVFFDPLEQFLIEVYTSYLSNTLSVAPHTYFSKMILFNLILAILSFYVAQGVLYQTKLQRIVLYMFDFVTNTVKSAVSVKKYSMLPLLYVLFLFIFFSNLLGMLPYSMTVTSHLILTIFLSLGLFLGTNIVGICYHQERIFLLFLPEGVPVVIIPFLILIEYISYFSRIFSLAIRLFANLMAGHILLKILIGFI